MIASLILGVSLVTAAAPADAKAAYEEAKARGGRDARAHVDLALWCEAHGMPAERLRHLALAVLLDPKDARARALMGLIAFRGRWERPEAVGPKVQADEEMTRNLAEYNERRAKLPHTADAHWKLALWCEDHDLKPEAVAHFTTVIRLDPRRDAAWKHLGYKQVKGRWLTDDQLASLKAEAEAQKQADIRWRKQLSILSTRLAHNNSKDEALQALAEISDPRAVPAIWATFVTGTKARRGLAAQLFGQIDSPAASKALVILALTSSSSNDRRTSAEILRRRDPREFAGLLIALIREPIKYEASEVKGPGESGKLKVKGKEFDVERQYTAPSGPNFQMGPGDTISYDANGLPVLNEVVGPVFQAMVHIDNKGNTTSTGDLSLGATMPILTPSGSNPHQAQLGNDIAGGQLGDKGKEIWSILSDQKLSGSWNMDWNGNLTAQSPLDSAFQLQLGLAAKGELYAAPGDRVSNFLTTRANVAHIPVGQMAIEAQRSAMRAQQQLQNDVATIEQTNAESARLTAPVLELLNGSTGQDFGPDRKAWSKWLADANGYAFISSQSDDRPTIIEEVNFASAPIPISVTAQLVGFQAISCFGKGTEVLTLTGRRKIEDLKAGDRVVTWNTNTGSLAMQPILTVYHNPPSATLKIELEGDSIVTTPWHRFWQAGQGWVVARDLKAGDNVRTVEGMSKVVSVSPMATQPVFNLEVAEDHNFLVGRSGALVHDNSVAPAIPTPFDGSPKETTSAAATTPKAPAAGR